MLQITLPEALEKELQDVAVRAGQTVDDFVRGAVVQYLEDREDVQHAEESLREDGKTYTLDQMENDFGLED